MGGMHQSEMAIVGHAVRLTATLWSSLYGVGTHMCRSGTQLGWFHQLRWGPPWGTDDVMCVINVKVVVQEWVVLHLLGPQRYDDNGSGNNHIAVTMTARFLYLIFPLYFLVHILDIGTLPL